MLLHGIGVELNGKHVNLSDMFISPDDLAADAEQCALDRFSPSQALAKIADRHSPILTSR